jgi:hypothetical protein
MRVAVVGSRSKAGILLFLPCAIVICLTERFLIEAASIDLLALAPGAGWGKERWGRCRLSVKKELAAWDGELEQMRARSGVEGIVCLLGYIGRAKLYPGVVAVAAH